MCQSSQDYRAVVSRRVNRVPPRRDRRGLDTHQRSSSAGAVRALSLLLVRPFHLALVSSRVLVAGCSSDRSGTQTRERSEEQWTEVLPGARYQEAGGRASIALASS